MRPPARIEFVTVTGLPICSSAVEGVALAVRRWLESPAFQSLLARFDGPSAGLGDTLSQRLAKLEHFTDVRFNLRSPGVERWQTHQPVYPASIRDLASAALHMLAPPTDASAHLPVDNGDVLVLGGHVARMAQRVALARQLIAGHGEPAKLCALGSSRQLNTHEDGLAQQLGIGRPDDEADALDRLMCLVLGKHADWSVLRAEPAAGAPRATTLDALALFEAHRVSESRAAILVTSAHFAPYQHAEALAVLNGEVSTVGVEQGSAGPVLVRDEPSAADLLQEVHSAVKSLRMLVEQSRA